MSWSRPVFSSNVQEIGWNEDTGEMTVLWNSGKRSAYAGVPEELALQASKAASVGSFLNDEIKGQFAHRYV